MYILLLYKHLHFIIFVYTSQQKGGKALIARKNMGYIAPHTANVTAANVRYNGGPAKRRGNGARAKRLMSGGMAAHTSAANSPLPIAETSERLAGIARTAAAMTDTGSESEVT